MTKSRIEPAVTGALRTILKELKGRLKKIGIPDRMRTLQKSFLVGRPEF